MDKENGNENLLLTAKDRDSIGTRENILMIRSMVRVILSGKVETDIQVNFLMIKEKDSVKCTGLTEVSIRVFGIRVSKVGWG